MTQTCLCVATAPAWSTGGAMGPGRRFGGGAGTLNAGLAAFGISVSPAGAISTSQEYDGTTWSNSNSATTARYATGMGGNQNDALAMGGIIAPAAVACHEKYNGTNWANCTAAPVASAFSENGITWAVFIITLAATAGLTSVMLVMMLGQTRIFLGMAKDGLLPNFFKTLHPTFKTPHKSTILVGGIISIVAALTPINKVSEMCSMGTLLAFAMVCVAVMILRVKKPELERPYKTPAVYLVGTLGVAFNLFLMYFVRKETWIAFIVWGIIGITVYFLYSKRKSNLNQL
jgi:amino acid transporter